MAKIVDDLSGIQGYSLVYTDFYKTSGDRGDMSDFEPSLARQEFAAECDINTIMARYEATGAVSHVNQAQPIYMDTTQIPNLQGAMDILAEATVAFMSLPASVRKEFDNDAVKFVDFAQEGKNLDKMREWGLAPPEPTEAPPVKVFVSGGSFEPANDDPLPVGKKAPKGA